MGAALLALVMAVAGLAGCGGDDRDTLVVYSGRNQNLVGPLLERFARETGTDINVRYADTTELTPTLLEEGSATRADVFFSQDAGALAALGRRDRLASLPGDVLEQVDARFRDPNGRWVGVTGRARVIAYNTDRLAEADLPRSTLDVVDPRWKAKVGFPPTNASFVAFVSALIEQVGRDRTRAFLEGLKANDAKRYDNNVLVLDAVSRGEVELGLVNHYYLYNEFKERPGAPVANFYPGQGPGGEGTFVNVAGVAILAGTDEPEAAERFVRFLLGESAQRYFRDETSEYPLRRGVEPIAQLPPLDSLRTIDVPLQALGRDLDVSLALIKEVGLS
ncbi:MAG TPA: iron ABC transporter substrate-binding protein [Acidimicrobiales bacterium]|nr:iron ABC transporter substrate-binding protein [Acidimicrobiales bacterium]